MVTTRTTLWHGGVLDYLAGLTCSGGFGRVGNPIARPPNVNGRGGGSRGSTSGGADVPRLEV
jgi:hypothetical protein